MRSLYLSICSINIYSQKNTDSPLEKCLGEFNSESNSSEKSKFTNAEVKFCLLGNRNNLTVVDKNAAIRVLKNALFMRLGYYASQNITPISVPLILRSFSTEPDKYVGNSKLTIFLEDGILLSENMEMQSSIKFAEIFSIKIKYADFLKLTVAKKVKIQFGETIEQISDI